MLSRDSHISKCISWLKFPLAAMIVFMHTETSWDHADPSSIINATLSWTIPTAARATFYFIAGYLFFAGRKTFGLPEYTRALRRKFFTLLIPYLIWISIGYLCAFIINNENFVWYNLKAIFWANGTNYPEPSLLGYDCVPLGYPGGYAVMWYVRNLMIMIVLSPIIWVMTRTLRLWTIPVLLLAILLHIGFAGLENRTICYFTLGAALAILDIDPMNHIRRYAWIIISAWIVMCTAGSLVIYNFDMHHVLNGSKTILLRDLTVLTGVFALFAIASLSLRPKGSAADRTGASFNKLMLTLAPAGFFIYVVHPLPVVEIFARVTDPFVSDKWQITVAFIFFTAARLTLIPLLYFIMERYTPKTLAVITGGRTKKKSPKADTVSTLA